MFQPQPTPYSPFSSYVGASSQNQEQSTYHYQSTGLGLGNAGPIDFSNPVFHPIASYQALPLNPRLSRYGAMATPPNDDLVAQETLAREFQPELKGPLVGERRSSLEITEEYAKADPIYVAKTSTLPQSYSHYRPVKGDGNCGWRAIGFSYFETLLNLGDKKLVEAERARMIRLSDFVVAMTGHEAWIFEEWRDGGIKMLQDIANRILHGSSAADASSLLLPPFNNPEVSDGFVCWCRLLASAHLKSRPAAFQDFIPEMTGVEGYCRDVLEPSNNEIEHLGMTLLVEILLRPIGFAVEIVYLDRSDGTQVNTHYFPTETPGTERATIHLLYRPGHYDILYKEINTSRSRSLSQQHILESAVAHSDLHVRRATGFTHRHSIQGTPEEFGGVDMNILVNMPALFGPLTTNHGFSERFSPVQEFSPAPTHAASYSLDSSRSRHSMSPASSVSPGPSIIFPTNSTSLPIHPHTMAADVSPTAARIAPGASQFRPSMYQYKEDWGDTPAQGFQTNTFKNSHYNVSHYNNPNFQPEQWTPDCDEAVGKLTRHRTS